jgi:hypothetical protein
MNASVGQKRPGPSTSAKAETFRAKAAECDKLADQAKDPEAKRMFGEAANHWRAMAEQALRHGW